MYSWYQNIFRDCSTDSISCSEQKNRIKIILKQDSNSRQRQDIFTVSNLKTRKIKTLLSLPIRLDHHRFSSAAVAPLSLRCHSTVAAVAPAIAPDVATVVTPLSLLLSFRCGYAAASVAPLPLLSLLLSLLMSLLLLLLLLLCCHSCCCFAVAPLSLHYHSVISPLLLRCCSAAAAVTPSVAPAVAWIVHGRRLKRQNQGNSCHR